MSTDSLAIYTYNQIAKIKAVDKTLGDRLHTNYSSARRLGAAREQRAGEQVEDEYNRLVRAGKIES